MKPHQPVMLNEVLEYLNPRESGVYVDGTFGRGGYTEALLGRNTVVFAFDRDADAITSGGSLEKQFKGHLQLVHERFANMERALNQKGTQEVDGIALDLGVSSPQLDTPERGFSFRHDGPLDMRMGKSEKTAADIVNNYSEEELDRIIFTYGEERMARRIARAIVNARKEKPITRTGELAKIVRSVLPHSRTGIDPATRTFQALRIAVNDELAELEQGLRAAESLLKKGGRLVVVSFHSLEDRVVKNFFKARSGKQKAVSRHAPPANSNDAATFRILTPRPIQATPEEIKQNPRASSAKLRAAERIYSENLVENQMESLGVNPRDTGK